jgi:hypothetical protein
MAYSLPFLPGCAAHIDRATMRPARRSPSASTPSSAWRWPNGWRAPQGLLLIAVLIGVCVPLFNVAAVWPMARHAKTRLRAELVRNPLIVATVAGLLANLLGSRCRLAGTHAHAHRRRLAGAGPDRGRRGHAVRPPGQSKVLARGRAVDTPPVAAAGGVGPGPRRCGSSPQTTMLLAHSLVHCRRLRAFERLCAGGAHGLQRGYVAGLVTLVDHAWGSGE